MKTDLINSILFYAAILALWCLTDGCIGSRAFRAQGGKSSHVSSTGAAFNIQQPQNPKDSANQDTSVSDRFDFTVPTGSFLDLPVVESTPSGILKTNVQRVVVSAPMPVSRTHEEKSVSKVGASQPDVVGETLAKLKSSKWITVLGILIFLAGIGCAVYPPVSAILGGITPGAAMAASGLVIAVLPYLIIGNEKFLCVGIAGALAIALVVWYVHRHGGLQAELTTIKTVLGKSAVTPATGSVPVIPSQPATPPNAGPLG